MENPVQKRRLRGSTMTDDEHAQLKQGAKDHDMTMGEYIRYLVRKEECAKMVSK